MKGLELEMSEVNISIKDILEYLDSEGIEYDFKGDKNTFIKGFSDPSEYNINTVIWLGVMKHFNTNDETKLEDVALVLVSRKFQNAESLRNCIITDDPRNSFMLLVEHYYPEIVKKGIEKSAIIMPRASIGEGCYIGHNTIVEVDVQIGNGTVIQNNVVIQSGTIIGSNCRIEDNTTIGNPGFSFRKSQNQQMTRMPHLGRVFIEDNVDIGSNTIICKGTFKDTYIGKGVKIDAASYIGHNVRIGKNTLILGAKLTGNIQIGEECTIIYTHIANRINIGNRVKTGIGSVVIENIDDDVSCFGNPAKVINYNKSEPVSNAISRSSNNMEEEFLSFVAQIFEVPRDILTEMTEYNSISEWDSLMHLRLIIELEDKYKVQFPSNIIGDMNTLGIIYEHIMGGNSE